MSWFMLYIKVKPGLFYGSLLIKTLTVNASLKL